MISAQLHAQLTEVCSRDASRLAEIGRTEDEARQYFYLVELGKTNQRVAELLGHTGDPFTALDGEWHTCPHCRTAQRWDEMHPIGVQWDRESGERLEMRNTCCHGTFARELSPVIIRHRRPARRAA